MESGGPVPTMDVVRARWRRWRASQRLLEPEDDGFGHGGLGRDLPDLCTRLTVLPPDPEATVTEFDDDLWAWWGTEFDDPVTGGVTSWGSEKAPTVAAALHGSRSNGEWLRYLALHRHGGLELGLGRDGGMERDERRAFFLIQIVHRCWVALARFGELVVRFNLEGPFEVTLALAKTETAVLANFAAGWAEPGGALGRVPTCSEPNVLARRELPSLAAGGDGPRDLAFTLGGQIEDAWGVPQRRFIARDGELEGQFDSSRVRWH